jgi:O-antigen/teichoic acid export membrane protein
VARNAVLKIAVQATRLLSLLFVVLAARRLGPEAFGKFTLAYALAALFAAALDLGMHSILTREVARAPSEAGPLAVSAATLKAGLLIPVGLSYVALSLGMGRPPETTAAVWLLGLALALQSFIELGVAVFTGFERVEVEFGVRLTEKLVLLAVGLAGLALGGGLPAVCGAFVVAAGVSLVLAARLVDRRFVRLPWRVDRAGALALAGQLGWVAAAFVVALATTRLVPVWVALLGGDVAAGHFGAAVRVLDVVAVLPVALVAAVYPHLARATAAPARFRAVTRQAAEMLLLVGVPVALALSLGAPGLVREVYGPAYEATGPLLAILGGAAGLGFLNYLFHFVLLALGRPARLLAVAGAGLAINGLVVPPLVSGLGAAGGAWGLVLIEAGMLAAGVVALVPHVGLPFGGGALKVAAAAVGATLAAGVLPAAGAWRLGIALAVYGGGLLALRPVPPARWGEILRGGLGQDR